MKLCSKDGWSQPDWFLSGCSLVRGLHGGKKSVFISRTDLVTKVKKLKVDRQALSAVNVFCNYECWKGQIRQLVQARVLKIMLLHQDNFPLRIPWGQNQKCSCFLQQSSWLLSRTFINCFICTRNQKSYNYDSERNGQIY